VKTIHVRSLSASATDELLQQLPVHFGDSIDAAGVQALVENVRAFDDDLQVSVSPDRSNQLEISIAPAGTQEQHAQSAEPKKIRVGGNAQQTKLLVQTKPNYPPEAKAKGIQGAVVLEATIGKDGKVENLQVLSGEPLLAAAALDAVRSWQYSTTLLNGDPVEVVTNIDVNFTLAP
jgi:TonB family protein